MQITRAVVTPVELTLRQPVQMGGLPPISALTAIFVRLETRQGRTAWGCTVAHPDLNGVDPKAVLRACQRCATLVPDLHPTNLEYTLSMLAAQVDDFPAALCAFDLALHDLLGLAADMPLYRLLGGYRSRIQTSVTVPIAPLQESVEIAKARASQGFRMLKVKGGQDPDTDVQRIRAIQRALPDHALRLDADGGYDVKGSLEVARALEGKLEMIEQPTPAGDMESLARVTANSPVPILADQSVTDLASAFDLAARRAANGLSVKIASCGGLRCARQVDSIARAAQLITMVSCLIEPALLAAAGLSFALGSANVHYGDLDGYLDLLDDPTIPGFRLEQGWLIASEVPGLGCRVEL